MEQTVALVAIENVAYHFDLFYSYLIPEELRSRVIPGARVLVSFGRSAAAKRQGVVFALAEKEEGINYKSILSVLDDKLIVTEENLRIAEFLKERYFCTYYEAVRVQIPAGVSFKTAVSYFAVKSDKNISLSEDDKQVYEYMLSLEKFETADKIYASLGLSKSCGILDKLTAKKLIIKNYDASRLLKDASVKTAELSPEIKDMDDLKLTAKQKSVVTVLRDVGCATVKDICYFAGVTSSVVAALEKKNILIIRDTPVYRVPENKIKADRATEDIILTEQQKTAYDHLLQKYQNGGGVSLLYGVTGSGKTSVFLRLIDDVIADGKQVIVMVPEISLTPQMMAIFRGRYGNKVAIFHSALSAGERRDEFRRVAEGQVQIAVGTRSAVFLPFSHIGLIVIDEEQEHTYKSESSPRYHTRDVARFRASGHGALLLLSSATPSIESYTNAKRGKYSLETLTERYGDAVLPEVSVVDMKRERSSGNRYNISSELLERLEKNIEKKEQSILLINRRGFNTFVACDSCGSVVCCPYCSISLTYHSANNRLMCHYCGYSAPLTSTCPECGKNSVRYSGYGTQRIEQELEKLLPQAKVLRLDADTTSTRHAFEKGLIDFGEGKYDIMLGTQMVAKGLNFENVTLVGVINADQQLYNDDYKSEERTFDLLTQVVGRSGRGKSMGTALIQTLTPENHIIRLAQAQDYDGFYQNEIIIRKTMIYPPFCDLCSLVFVSEDEVKALNSSRQFLSKLRAKVEEEYPEQKIIVLGPMPPRISKVNNKFRYRLIVKCKNTKAFRKMISELLIEFGKDKNDSGVSLVADINPENLI
ncbi:MAG: primosomal protein N' [Oscillospiraceae bacterium]|nr:primosomal protein N' [Oscillospiraceae bacterium]